MNRISHAFLALMRTQYVRNLRPADVSEAAVPPRSLLATLVARAGLVARVRDGKNPERATRTNSVTFAVERLLATCRRHQVSIHFGHSSVTIAEKHYSLWAKARQVQVAGRAPHQGFFYGNS